MTLLDTISKRAQDSFNKPVTLDVFNEWSEHWFMTAETFYNELLVEGLELTAQKVRQDIEQQKKFSFYSK